MFTNIIFASARGHGVIKMWGCFVLATTNFKQRIAAVDFLFPPTLLLMYVQTSVRRMSRVLDFF